MEVMERKPESEKRPDDLSLRVESIDRRMETGFAEMREEFRAVRAEMKGESQAIRQEMATHVANLNQTMYRLFGGLIVAWVVGVIAIIAQT
jgi:predicted  nucleic acid-binding Zn-ribbon protein